MKLLSRDEFRSQVFKRDKNKCVICGRFDLKLDAHHIIDRKLFDDGGYYLDNGASLCDTNDYSGCHYMAEKCIISADDIRKAAGIKNVCLPKQFDITKRYDKWGTEL